ncbi:hypothetical protein LTSERUB_3069, partial [Salmonella enterica subsp. enterica serovar Rubislaw str. A4-653]
MRAQLDSAGYRHVDQVMEHGEYATRGARGALLDLFCARAARCWISFRWAANSLIASTFLMMKSTACVCLTRIPSVRSYAGGGRGH